MEVKFYEQVQDEQILFVVIVCRYKDTWVWVKHRERSTYEIPGGHREKGESILDAARRELEEETGAILYDIIPIKLYSVVGKTRVNESGEESFGMLFYADIKQLGKIHSEIECVAFFDDIPDELTYPTIQPRLHSYVKECLIFKKA